MLFSPDFNKYISFNQEENRFDFFEIEGKKLDFKLTADMLDMNSR